MGLHVTILTSHLASLGTTRNYEEPQEGTTRNYQELVKLILFFCILYEFLGLYWILTDSLGFFGIL